MRLRLALTAALAALASLACAQSYPNKPIRLIVPFPAGGPTDVYARIVGQKLSEAWGQPVIVDNRAGATGLIGSLAVKNAPPDGYTLLYTSNSAQVIGPLLRTPHPFDPTADFTPVVMPQRYPIYVLTAARLPVRSFKEFIALAKSRPGKLSYSSVGVGSGGHLACELLNIAAGTETLHVPYKGAAPAQAALSAGEVDYMCDSVGFSQPLVAAGKMRGLAITAAKRSPAVPDVPTLAEQGVPGVEAYIWQGVFGPKGLPAPIRDKLAGEITRIMKLPAISERLAKDGSEVMVSTPEQFARTIDAEKAIWAKVIAEKGIKAE